MFMVTETDTSVLSLSEHFDALLSAIEPSEDRKSMAAEIPGAVRDFLKESTSFPTVKPHTRLVGSHARHTANGDIKDVDVLVFVGTDRNEHESAEVLNSLGDALKTLPSTMRLGDGKVDFRRQRRSIHVHILSQNFRLDIVPTLIPEGTANVLLVPDREWKKWIDSHPLGYAEALSQLNTDSGEKAVPLIKLFKHWRSIQMTYRRPKSYYLEALVYRHLSMGWVDAAGKSHAELFTEMLRSVHSRWEVVLEEEAKVPRIPDPMLCHNVAFNWERAAFETFMWRLKESIGWAERDLTKDEDQMGEAIALWQKVFGAEYFVDAPDLRMREKALLVATRGAFVSSTGAIHSRRPTGEPAVQAPKHRFYGEES